MTPKRRRRGAELERAVFDATLRELTAVGFARLTMDGVASAAHTGKASLYRRWDNKNDLVVDAVRSVLPRPAPPPAGASLREELVSVLSRIQHVADAAGAAAFRAMAAQGGQRCHPLLEVELLQPCRDGVLAALRRAAGRGEIDPAAVHPDVAAIGPALVVDRILAGDGPLSDASLAAVTDRVLLAFATAAPARPAAG